MALVRRQIGQKAAKRFYIAATATLSTGLANLFSQQGTGPGTTLNGSFSGCGILLVHNPALAP